MLEGLAVALANIDEFIETIKTSPTPPVAKAALMSKGWDQLAGARDACARAKTRRPEAATPIGPMACRCTTACSSTACTACRTTRRGEILQMRLQRLTGLEQDKIISEYKEVMDAHRRPARHPGHARARGDASSATSCWRCSEEFGQTKVGARRSVIERNVQELRHRRPDHAAPTWWSRSQPHRLHQEPGAVGIPGADARRARQAGRA